MKYGVKWAEDSWGLMFSVIRIALKWLIGLLCGYVVTTAGVTQAHHIRHQSEGCVVMMYRLFLVEVLHSQNDNSTWDFICLVSIRMLRPDTCIKSAASSDFSVVYFTGRPQTFQHALRKVWQMLYFSGCSLRIPVGLPLFKLWQETLVWWVYCMGRRKMYIWLALIKVWE